MHLCFFVITTLYSVLKTIHDLPGVSILLHDQSILHQKPKIKVLATCFDARITPAHSLTMPSHASEVI